MNTPRLGPWQQKWRLVHISANHEHGWVTIQFPDLAPLRYPEVKDHQESLRNLIQAMDMEMGSIGDSYSAWIPNIYLPEWVAAVAPDMAGVTR